MSIRTGSYGTPGAMTPGTINSARIVTSSIRASGSQGVDTRLTTLETKTQNQTAILDTTTYRGTSNFKSPVYSSYNQNLIISSGSLVNSIASYAYDETQPCQLSISSGGTEFSGSVNCVNGLTTNNLESNQATFTGQINIGSSQAPDEIFNNGSSLTDNDFNTRQSIGCIGFKDNWLTATGNNLVGKQDLFFMSNANKLIVVSNSTPQYFDDTTGALINVVNGIVGGTYCNISSLGIAYSRNATQYSTSVDGINWTIATNIISPATSNGYPVIHAFGLYIYTGGPANFLIQTSTDGITWINRATGTRTVYTIIFTGTRLITFGAFGCMYSTDGITWVNDTVQLNNIRAAIYCESFGCILAQILTANTNLLRSYDNGLTWTTLTNVFPAQLAISSGGNNKFEWDESSGKAYCIMDDNSGFTNNAYLFEFDASGNVALGGSIQMMGETSALKAVNGGLYYYRYNPLLKRFYYSRNAGTPYKVFYSTPTLNQAVSGNQYILGSLNCSGGYNPYGLANIDIMLRDCPFIGIQFQHGSGTVSTFSNSLWTALGSTSSVASTYAITNNFTRQLCCANWSFPSPGDGQICGYGSTITTGAQVSRGFNFGLSAILGISDTGYNANNCQNFFGLWNLSTAIPLNQATQLSVQRNMICFGSNTTDTNICIYTAGPASTVKQVDLGVSFPANRPSGSVSTDFFKFTLYWDTSKFHYKAHNTTTNVIVSGTFSALVSHLPSTSLYPQCVRIMGSPQTTGQGQLQVQRFGVYY
jgi:hypothetical protein